MPAEKTELPLRIVVDDPVPGVALALQKGKSGGAELVYATIDERLQLGIDHGLESGGFDRHSVAL